MPIDRWRIHRLIGMSGGLCTRAVTREIGRAIGPEDAELPESLEDLGWRGARRGELEDLCRLIGETEVVSRMPAWRPA
jgi:hypothetical protein